MRRIAPSPGTPATPEPAPVEAAIDAAAERARAMPDAHEPTDARPRARFFTTPRVLWFLAGLLVICGWDRVVWLLMSSEGKKRFDHVEGPWKWFVIEPLYWAGRLEVWASVALLLVMATWLKPDTAKVMNGVRRAIFVLVSACVGGTFAEGVKIFARRLRPEKTDGMYAFKAWSGPGVGDWWSTVDIGLASSHAGTVFAGAVALGIVLPRVRVWVLAVAVGCAFVRVVQGAHYPSDVYVGGLCGVLGAWLVYWIDARNNRGIGIDGRAVAAGGWARPGWLRARTA